MPVKLDRSFRADTPIGTYWLGHSAGFRVKGRRRSGTVEEIGVALDGRVDAVIVRHRGFVRSRLIVVPIESVATIDPWEERVILARGRTNGRPKTYKPIELPVGNGAVRAGVVLPVARGARAHDERAAPPRRRLIGRSRTPAPAPERTVLPDLPPAEPLPDVAEEILWTEVAVEAPVEIEPVAEELTLIQAAEPEPIPVYEAPEEPEPGPPVLEEPEVEPEPLVIEEPAVPALELVAAFEEPEPEPVVELEPEPVAIAEPEPEPEPVAIAEPEPEPVAIAEPAFVEPAEDLAEDLAEPVQEEEPAELAAAAVVEPVDDEDERAAAAWVAAGWAVTEIEPRPKIDPWETPAAAETASHIPIVEPKPEPVAPRPSRAARLALMRSRVALPHREPREKPEPIPEPEARPRRKLRSRPDPDAEPAGPSAGRRLAARGRAMAAAVPVKAAHARERLAPAGHATAGAAKRAGRAGAGGSRRLAAGSLTAAERAGRAGAGGSRRLASGGRSAAASLPSHAGRGRERMQPAAHASAVLAARAGRAAGIAALLALELAARGTQYAAGALFRLMLACRALALSTAEGMRRRAPAVGHAAATGLHGAAGLVPLGARAARGAANMFARLAWRVVAAFAAVVNAVGRRLHPAPAAERWRARKGWQESRPEPVNAQRRPRQTDLPPGVRLRDPAEQALGSRLPRDRR